jgi:hypothetical protein
MSTDELDDPFAPTEMNVEGSLFSMKTMEELMRAYQQGCWFWNDDYTALIYRDPQIRIAAPIAESGRELIEQAKEEAFFAWGL